MQVVEPPVATPPPRRPAAALLLLAGAFLITLLCVAGLWLVLSAGSAGLEAALPWSPANPARGCPPPVMSRQEAVDRVMQDLIVGGGVTVGGAVDGRPVLAAAEYVTGGAAALMVEEDPESAAPGCAWVFELHVKFAPHRAGLGSPYSPVVTGWQRVAVMLEDSGGGSVSFVQALCSGVGTPCPTMTPPTSGWPTAVAAPLATRDWLQDVKRRIVPAPTVPAPWDPD